MPMFGAVFENWTFFGTSKKSIVAPYQCLTVQKKPSSHHVSLSSLAWLTKDTDLTALDEVIEDDTSTRCLLHALCLMPQQIYGLWNCLDEVQISYYLASLCWQKHGLDLSASSILNPCFWTPRSCLLVVSARRKWQHRFQSRKDAKIKHLRDLECILRVLYTAK